MANSKAKATANIKKNRIYITIAGNADSKALEQLYTDIRFCVADLKPGFEVVSDISQCNLIYLGGFPIYKKIIDYLIAHNVGEIIRIIKNDNISFKQIVNFSEKIHCYRTIYADNKEQAEAKLEQLIKRAGIRLHVNPVACSYELNGTSVPGNLADISVSGCAFMTDAVLPPIEAAITVTLTFSPHESFCADFHLAAKVVRHQGQLFAVQFHNLDQEDKQALYKRLAHEINQVSFIL